MYRQFNIEQYYVLPTQCTYLCVLYGSENKQRLFTCTALTGWFLQPRRRVFTARYGLNLYIQNRFMLVFRVHEINTINYDNSKPFWP